MGKTRKVRPTAVDSTSGLPQRAGREREDASSLPFATKLACVARRLCFARGAPEWAYRSSHCRADSSQNDCDGRHRKDAPDPCTIVEYEHHASHRTEIRAPQRGTPVRQRSTAGASGGRGFKPHSTSVAYLR